jgi:AhpD family alkylhydroperoxidase
MARLQSADPHGVDLLRRLTFASAKRMFGRPLEPTTIIAHHRPLLLGYSAIAMASERFSHALPARSKRLAMLRAAQLVGCEWCLDFGSWLAHQAGDSDELFARLRDRFDERQIVELTVTIALENFHARTNWALGIEGEGFSEGMYCVAPEAALVSDSAAR